MSNKQYQPAQSAAKTTSDRTNSPKQFSFIRTTALSLLLFAGMLTNAQDSATTRTLDEVVVTATKYPVKLGETGKSISVITRQQIEQNQGKSLSQILTEQSGMIVNGAYSNPGKDKSLYLRGASNKYTLILLDGVPVMDPSGPGGAFDLRLFPVEQIERIEILKGSQSTLYGSDAIAGVINIITKKDGSSPIGIYGGANYGTYNTFNGNAGLNGKIRAVDYNVGYTYSRTDGISEALDKTGNGNFDKDGLMRNSIQANVSFNAGKNLKIAPYYRYSYYKGDYDADAFTDGPDKFNALLNNGGAIATFSLPKGTITANYGHTYARRNYITAWGESVYKGILNTSEIYLTQALSKNIKLLAGASYQRYGIKDTSLDNSHPQTTLVSPYASFAISTGSGFNIDLGGRYNHHSEFGGYFTYSVNPYYLIGSDVKIFANLSSGFKAPTLTELFGKYSSNPNLKPEKSVNVEGGAQVQLLHNKLDLTATGYYRDITNLIVYVSPNLINIDKQKDRGIEIEAAYRPDDKWNIRLNYHYVTGNISQTRSGKDTSYFNLVRRPKHSVTGSIGYQATKKLYFSVSAQSIGKRTDMFFDPNPPYGSAEVNLSAYTLLNAYAEYKPLGNRLAVFADARNLGNAKFTEVYGYATMGFTITGGVRFQLASLF